MTLNEIPVRSGEMVRDAQTDCSFTSNHSVWPQLKAMLNIVAGVKQKKRET